MVKQKLDYNISADHPFYNLEGSDNIVLFFTDRYTQCNHYIIKGAGAGADVTASGIFADIIRIGNINNCNYGTI